MSSVWDDPEVEEEVDQEEVTPIPDAVSPPTMEPEKLEALAVNVLERVAREVVPEIAERIIQEKLDEVLKEQE